MGSSSAVPPAFATAFREKAGGRPAIAFADFMSLALYHPTLGYYRRDRPRVGYGAGTDFYTASTSGVVFGELVAAACTALLGGEARAKEATFVEIGAETEEGVLAGVEHPFASVRTVRVGGALDIRGRCVVFSNELFDAQPLRRFVRRGTVWKELGVELRDETTLVEVELEPEANASKAWLPPADSVEEGYVFDAPRAAARLVESLCDQPWSGLFVAFDYGKSLAELATATPAGTARAYFQHTQSNELLARAGEQDLTGHVCWDWLSDALAASGFASPRLESQESFFIHQAGAFLAQTMAGEANRLSQRKLALMQLLHPTHLGQKFQVLHALRQNV